MAVVTNRGTSQIRTTSNYGKKYYLPIYAWVFQVVSFRQVSPLNPSMQLSYLPCIPHVPPNLILLDFVKPRAWAGLLLRRGNWK